MAPGGWEGSTRRETLPEDWSARVAYVRRRAGGRCEHRYPNGGRCPRPGTDCDHVRDRDDHSYANLQWLCRDHHARKTARQANDAKRAKYNAKRPPERHPGDRRS